jgi:hypothetical protein
MLTFNDRLWIADGQRYKNLIGGNTFTSYRSGLICPATSIDSYYSLVSGVTGMTVAGATMLTLDSTGNGNQTFISRGVYVAYSYQRSDSYVGPVDFLTYARNIVVNGNISYGAEFFSLAANQRIVGITVPSFFGISSISIWIATDTVTNTSDRQDVSNIGYPRVGDLGWGTYDPATGIRAMSITLKPSADLTRFRLFTTMAANHLFTAPISFSLYGSSIGWAATFWPVVPDGAGGVNASFGFWSDYQSLQPFSGMAFCWYDTNTPKYIDVNQNVMFMSGFSNTPSTVWFSEVGEPEVIDPENNFEVRTNDGDRIIGHRTYNGNIIVFKTTSFHKVIGADPSDFQLVELSLEFGCLSNQAIVEYNEKLVWLDKKGIIQYDGASWRCISDSIEEVFRSMNLNAAYEKAVAVHYKYRNQIWFGIPTGSSTENNLTVVWDYLLDAWTFFEGYNPSMFAWAQGNLTKPTVWYGTYSGKIAFHNESFYGDNGAGITCLAFSRFEQFQGENATNVWRRLFLDVSPATGVTGAIRGRVFTDYNKNTVKATFTMYQTAFQSKAEMGVVGKAVAFDISHHSASLPFLMNGYTWAKRYLRNV